MINYFVMIQDARRDSRSLVWVIGRLTNRFLDPHTGEPREMVDWLDKPSDEPPVAEVKVH